MLADWKRGIVAVLRQERAEGLEARRRDAGTMMLPAHHQVTSRGPVLSQRVRASIIPFLFIIIDGALSNRRVSAVPDPCSGCLVMCEVCA